MATLGTDSWSPQGCAVSLSAHKIPPQTKAQLSLLCPCSLSMWCVGQGCHQPWHWWLWAALLSWAVIKCALGGPDHLVWLNHLNSQNRSGSRIALLLLHIVEPRFLPAYPWLCSREECGKTVLINLQLSLY